MIAAMDYPWPGNVRELENVVHRQFLLAERGVLKLELPATTCVAGDVAAAHDSVRGEAASLALMDMKAAKAKVIERFEREYLETVIAAAGGNVSAAARRLGISRSTLYRRLRPDG